MMYLGQTVPVHLSQVMPRTAWRPSYFSVSCTLGLCVWAIHIDNSMVPGGACNRPNRGRRGRFPPRAQLQLQFARGAMIKIRSLSTKMTKKDFPKMLGNVGTTDSAAFVSPDGSIKRSRPAAVCCGLVDGSAASLGAPDLLSAKARGEAPRPWGATRMPLGMHLGVLGSD